MTSKLFAPFKDFPQQFSIFNKFAYKNIPAPMASFNSVYGMLNDVTCTSFDDKMNLLALGTKKGEIKIYGSSGLIVTLVKEPITPVDYLKFIEGQARITSIYENNDIVTWDYRRVFSKWLPSSTFSEASHKSEGKITAFGLNYPLSSCYKSEELVLFGNEQNVIQQFGVDKGAIDVCSLYEYLIDLQNLLSKCSDLPKDYDIGNIVEISFNPSNHVQVYFSFKNGLVLILNFKDVFQKVSVEKDVSDIKLEKANEAVQMDKVTNNTSPEKSNDNISLQPDDRADTEKEKEMIGKTNEIVEKIDYEGEKLESEKENVVESTSPKPEDKQDNKTLEETTELSDVSKMGPKLLNYIVRKEIKCICWFDNKIKIVSDHSDLINVFEITGDGSKLSEPQQIITVVDNIHNIMSKLTFFKLKGENMGMFITSENEKQNLLILTKNDKYFSKIETPSRIIDYFIANCPVSDADDTEVEPRVLLIICESKLIAIDLQSEDLSEIQCPYLGFQNTSPITSLTGIIQVPISLFSNTKTVNEVFKDWPLKSPVLPNAKTGDNTTMDIFGTGHADGSICIWQVMEFGVLNLLNKAESSFLLVSPTDKIYSYYDEPTPLEEREHRYIESAKIWLPITNIQLILHDTSSFSDSSSNELFCIVSTATGTILVFKYDGSDAKENITEIFCLITREDVNSRFVEDIQDIAMDLDLPDIGHKLPNLRSIIKVCPLMPVTSLAFQPGWELLGIGCIFGLALVDLRENKCVFSHVTVPRKSKDDATSLSSLSFGEQFKKSIKQSFIKTKQLLTKEKSTTDEDKSAIKEIDKQTEKAEENEPPKLDEKKGEETQETIEDTKIVEEKAKEEITDEENIESCY